MEDSLEPNLMVVVPPSVDSSESSFLAITQDNPLGITPNLFSHPAPSSSPGSESPSFTCLQLSARESQYQCDTSTSFEYYSYHNEDIIPASPDDLHIDLCLSPKSSDMSRMSDSDSPCKRHSDDAVNSPDIIPCTNSQQTDRTDMNSNYVKKPNTNETGLQEINPGIGSKKTVIKSVYEEDTQIYSDCELKQSHSEQESEARESMADFVDKCIANKVAPSQCILTGSTQRDSDVVHVPECNIMSSEVAVDPHMVKFESAKVTRSQDDNSQQNEGIHLHLTFSQSQSQLDDAVSQASELQVVEKELVTSKCDDKTEGNSQTIEYTEDSEVISALGNECATINGSNNVSQADVDNNDLKREEELTDENLATLPFSHYTDSQSQVQDNDSTQNLVDIMPRRSSSKDSQLPTVYDVASTGYNTTHDLDQVEDDVKQVIDSVINLVERSVGDNTSSLHGFHSQPFSDRGEKSRRSSIAAENTSQESDIGLFLLPHRFVRSSKLLPSSQTSTLSMESEVSASGPGYEEEEMDKSSDTIPVENNSDQSISLETGCQVSPHRAKDRVVYRITKYVVKEKLLNDRVISSVTYHHKPMFYYSDPSSSHSSSGSGYLADISSLSRSSSNSSTQTHLSQSPGLKTQTNNPTLRRHSSGTSGSSIEGFLRPGTSLSAKTSKRGNLDESNLSHEAVAPSVMGESPGISAMILGSESIRSPNPKMRRGRVVLTPIDYVNLPADITYSRIPATAFGNVTDSPIASEAMRRSAKVIGSVATPEGTNINPISVSTPVPVSSVHAKNEDSFSDGTTSDSPEIPYPDSFPQTSQCGSLGSEPCDNLLPPKKEELPVKLNIKDGIPILAKAGGENFYYPGIIRGQDPTTGKYTIWFEDDGKERVIRENDILLIDMLPVGQEVFVQSDSDNPKDWYSAGSVLSYWRESDQRGYVIQKAATDCRRSYVRRYARKQVIVKQNDLGNELKMLQVQPVSGPTTANVSLDNIVDGKRKRRSTFAHSSTSSSSKSSGNTPRSTRKRSTATDSQSSESSACLPFPSTHKPKRARLSFNTSKPTRMKQKEAELTKETRNQSTIFKNCGFLFTSTTGSDQPSSEFDSPPYSSNTMIYDRDAIKKMIVAGQGIVAKTFPQLMSCDRSRLYVISDGFCRTISYFSALATGIACLSYLWITDCTSIGKLNPTDSYLLQAGYSTYHQRVVERSVTRSQPLSGMHICLQINNAMTMKWNALLSMAGCHSVSNLQKDAALSCDVLVADPSCPDEVVQRARNLKIPIVSLEWVIQCLISGEMLPFDGHRYFKHTSN